MPCFSSSSVSPPGRLVQAGVFLTVAMVTSAIGGCSLLADAPNPGELQEHQRILAGCEDAPPASLVAIDGTGSSDAEVIAAERLEAVESIVRTTAVCAGDAAAPLRVFVFSASSAGTTTLYDGTLHPEGATDNARLRRVPDVVESVMADIRDAYEPAVADLPGGGSDILGVYRLAEEWAAQVGAGDGGDSRLRFALFTDGFHNTGVRIGDEPLSEAEAEALAEETSVPALPSESSIVVAGLGRVADEEPPDSAVVEGLVAYYTALCEQTGAGECVSVTDYTVGR